MKDLQVRQVCRDRPDPRAIRVSRVPLDLPVPRVWLVLLDLWDPRVRRVLPGRRAHRDRKALKEMMDWMALKVR